MFQKIIPALNANPFSSYSVPDATDEAAPDSLEVLRSKLFARSEESAESETLATINIMESLVLRHIDSVLQRFNVCKCDRCRCDVAACALNLLPPKYIAATPAQISEVEKTIPQNIVMDALIKAVIQVRANPRH